MTEPVTGLAETVADGIRRVLAPNPGPMTHWGTNSYLVGTREVVVIDPGPGDDTHLAALAAALRGARVTAILVTHAHRDHSALAQALCAVTGAPVVAFGRPEEGRSAVMRTLAAEGLTGGGEGVDAAFTPDETLGDGDGLTVDGATLEAVHTPGHFAGHLSFRVGDHLFSGDHVMEWSTTLISPPDGDLAAFMASTRRLVGTGLATMLPGHGPGVADPDARLSELLAHRTAREVQILSALDDGPADLGTLTRRVYTGLDTRLLPAAARNTLAHLIDLVDRKEVIATPYLSMSAVFLRP